MFTRWGAFVYRRRRIVADPRPSRSGWARLTLAGRASAELTTGGWLDPNSESAGGRRPPRRTSAAGAGAHRAVPLGDARRGRHLAGVPGGHRRHAARTSSRPERVDGVIGYAETGDDRFISEGRRRGLRRRRARTSPTRSRSSSSTGRERAPSPTDGTRLRSTGFGPMTRGLRRAVRDRTSPRRDRVAADRGGRADPRLRSLVARRACRCSSPASPSRRRSGSIGLVAQADRDEHLRPEHRDDARPRARDRLLAVHDQPLPGGAAPAAGPSSRRSSVAVATAGKAVAVLRAWRSRSACPGCCWFRRSGPALDRHRRRDRGRSRPCSTA